MNTLSMNIALALTLTFATFTTVPATVYAADHDSHASGHAETKPAAEATQTYTANGVVDGVDKSASKISITHEPVPALGWPAMTMRFTVEDASLLDDLKAGDKVRFDFRNQGNVSIILDIEARR